MQKRSIFSTPLKSDFEEPKPEPPKESPAVAKTRRRLNRWSVFALIAGSAFLTIVYVSNVLKVRTLLEDIRTLEKRSAAISYKNEALRTEIVRLRSAERITRIASTQLGLVQPESAPEVLR